MHIKQIDTFIFLFRKGGLREGAVGLSIDAVAKEAGISKATVMYDHKSKQDLLSDLISRLMSAEEERVQQAIAESNNSPHLALYARIISAGNALSHTERAVVLAVSASLANDTNIRDTMRSCTNKDLDEIKRGPKPEAAALAYLALSGLYCLELFDFYKCFPGERDKIIEGIRCLYESYPDKSE
ncbi:TetR/AcrR family transcriptional regulator [Providencia rettgeri]|uniref:TetR/AcrR family transcriptional regulator n=1 Tax=Providencia rettgeri TaxID=587 RepID=UPI001010CE22|nr:TetR/AcrR family transcriptional regulator [Providencia rettgeri]